MPSIVWKPAEEVNLERLQSLPLDNVGLIDDLLNVLR